MPQQTRIRIALFVFFIPMAGALRAGDEPRPWRVLVLQTGDFYVPANLLQVQGMRSVLTAGPHPVELRAEALDITRVELPELEPDLLALLKKKDRGVAFDLVMPMGGEALEFAQRHRAELWPGVPIVFFSVAEETTRTLRLDADVTGVTMAFDVLGTLDLALRLQPSARQVVLIVGASEFDRGWVPVLEEATRQRAGRLKATLLAAQPLAVLLDTVMLLPPDSFVLFTTVFRDGAGQPYVSRNVLEQVALASSVPVYGIAETYLGHGMVGGSISGLEAHGRSAGEFAVRVLQGESADTIPVQPPAPAVPMLDWQQLRRWGLSEGALPPGSVVLFKRPSFWDVYRGYALAATLGLLVQTGLIAGLMLQRRRARRAERESREQQAELAQASRLVAVGALTATIAHEINQPLGAILGNAEAAAILLEANPHDLEPVRQILAEIQNEDHRASDVIRHVRSLLSKAPLEMKPLALNGVVRDVLEMVAPNARGRGIAIDLKLATGLPAVRGDGVHLQQMLLNLMLNGMEALGQVREEDRRILVRTVQAGDSAVELAISDTGPGIPPELLPRLFESFFTSKRNGMGLGLSIVRSVVEAHGGRIRAENNPDRGAIFRVSLPVVDAEIDRVPAV